jgi:hypothetical protein
MSDRFLWRSMKTDANLFLTSDHPTLPFGFEIGKIVKYAGLNSDQLDLILGKNLARLLRIESRPSASKTMDITQSLTATSPDAYRRLMWRKWIGLSVTRK